MPIIVNIESSNGIHFPFKNIGGTRQSLAVKGYTTTVVGLVNLLAYWIPVKPMQTEIVESIQIENTTAIAGGKAQLFVFNESEELIFQSSDIPCTSLAITTVTFPSNFTIEKGKVYYFGIYTNGNISFKAIGTADLYSYGRVAGATTGLTVMRGSIAVYGTLPTTLSGFTGVTYNTLSMPEMLYKLT
jgi:hypothetical protein